MNELKSFYWSNDPKKILKTEGWKIHFADGTSEFDVLAGGLSFICGQGNRDILEGLEDAICQVSRSQSNKGHYTDSIVKAGEILTQGMWHSHSWALSGTNAVEAAISMSDEYWAELGEYKPHIVSFPFAWHGSSYLAKSLGTPEILSHVSSRVKHATEESLEDILDQNQVGCIIFETSTFMNGIRPRSRSFWKRIRDICDERNILMITDDVASCWGRCKDYHTYNVSGYGIQPDISAVGKALTGGYSPLGAALCNDKVGEVISKPGVWKYPGTWQPSMVGIHLMINTYNYMSDNNLITNTYNIENQLNILGKRLLDKEVIDEYRFHGAFFAFDLKDQVNASGYSSTKTEANTIKGCAPLIANEEYFKELETYVYQS